MKNSTYDPRAGFSFKGSDAHVSLGWLLTPTEFAAECATLKQRPTFDAWAVMLQLPDAHVATLSSPLVPREIVLTLLVSPAGVQFPVVTLQAAGMQVRILLCLVDESTQRWFRAVTTSGVITLAFDVPETNQLAVTEVPCRRRSDQEVDGIITMASEMSSREFELDAAEVVRAMVQPNARHSVIGGFAVQDLRVVLVLEPGTACGADTAEMTGRVLN